MWERFSYYGMRALLVLYMVKYLLDPQRSSQVLGLGPFKNMLEFVFGPLALEGLQVVGRLGLGGIALALDGLDVGEELGRRDIELVDALFGSGSAALRSHRW